MFFKYTYATYTNRMMEAMAVVAAHRAAYKTFTTNPAFEGTDYAASAKASMRVGIEMVRYWRRKREQLA